MLAKNQTLILLIILLPHLILNFLKVCIPLYYNHELCAAPLASFHTSLHLKIRKLAHHPSIPKAASISCITVYSTETLEFLHFHFQLRNYIRAKNRLEMTSVNLIGADIEYLIRDNIELIC